ncbi:MAG: hypothetical protein ACK4YF_08115 [Exilispira sp.]
MKNNLLILVFKVDNTIFGFLVEEKVKILQIEKKEFFKIQNLISIKTILKSNLNLNFEKTNKIKDYNLINYEGKNILIPYELYKIKLDNTIEDSGNNFIIKKIEFNKKEITILSIKWILKNYFIDKSFTYENEEIENKAGEKMQEEKDYKTAETNIDEEKKKEIFNQIEKEIDRLRISNFHEIQKTYMKESKSFTPQLILLYSILIVLAIVVFIVLSFFSGQQENKMAEEIKNIGGMESLIIKELQKKQEQERNQLNEQLKEISMQLESIQKQKEQFEKNQILALNAKTKEIEDEYLKKMEEEKNKLNRGLISRAEYDKRIKELMAEKDRRIQDERNKFDSQRKVYMQQLEAKENELKSKENSYKQALSEKEKQIEEANKAIKTAEEKLALSEEAQKKIALENEQLKQSSALQLKLRESILSYYKKILISYRNNDKEKLKTALNEFYYFIFNNPSASILAEDEKLFDKFVIDIILEDLKNSEDELTRKVEKSKLLEKAFNDHKKGNLISSYESYYTAFTRYDVIVDNERIYFEDFLKLVYEKQNLETTQTLEAAATPLYNSILSAYQNKNYNQVIQLANDFLSLYSNSKNALSVVEYKVKAEEGLKIKNQENAAAALFQKAKNYYNANDYDNAVKVILELFSKYGSTSYSTLSSELMEKIYANVKQKAGTYVESLVEVQTDSNEIKIGNVFKIFPEIIQIIKDPNLSTKIEIGYQLIVKHKNENGTYTMTAIVEVTSYSTTLVNAKIIKVFGKGPNIGDYVFLIKK